MGGTTLLLIDAQNDFHPGGSLAIPDADKDADRISRLIRRGTMTGNRGSKKNNGINRIVATLDSHHKLHIAHPAFWVSGQDGVTRPSPFTIISNADVKSGKWKPRENLSLPIGESLVDEDVLERTYKTSTSNCYEIGSIYDEDGNLNLLKYCEIYTKLLEEKGKFSLCIWPEHCIIGTVGHCVVPRIMDAMQDWSQESGGNIEWIQKGQNLLTEMYSALSSEVPITPSTSFQKNILENLMTSDRILIAGQALSHCVNYTVRDIVDHIPNDQRHKILLLSDCASSVPSFETASEDILKFLKDSGVHICRSDEVEFSSS
mmetsp:Transcript_242/g.376  ORF Transcript_242/g.376 Transcript_242/m.376 type:complete len:317 (+) Transcript_242:75-1025(+)